MSFDPLKIPFSKATDIITLIVSILCPSILLLFYYNLALFERLDTIKLILLSTATGLPFYISTYFITHLMHSLTVKEGEDLDSVDYTSTVFGGILNLTIWILTLIVAGFISLHHEPTLFTVIWVCCSHHLFAWSVMLYVVILRYLREKKKLKKNK